MLQVRCPRPIQEVSPAKVNKAGFTVVPVAAIAWQAHSGLADETGAAVPAAWQRRRAEKGAPPAHRSEEHTSELQSLMRISYAVFCLKKKITEYTCTLLAVVPLRLSQLHRCLAITSAF